MKSKNIHVGVRATPGPTPVGSRWSGLLAWLPSAAWAGLLVALSSLPGNTTPGGLLPDIPHADKLVHAGAYAVLGGLLAGALGRRGGAFATTWLIAVAIGLVHGVLDEIHQGFVPHRDPDLLDVAADVTGTAFGALARLKVAAGAAAKPQR